MTPAADVRRCLREPIPEIYEAAHFLNGAAFAHLDGRSNDAVDLIQRANNAAIAAWAESIWGKKSRYLLLRPDPASPSTVSKEKRGIRMPSSALKAAVRARDGYHCRFCGIPVIREEVRTMFRKCYPAALPWGKRNVDKHAAFQVLWLQYDHLQAHSRGGDNSEENLVITCAPCNFGRIHYTLGETGLLNPLARAPFRSSWDGLERLLRK